MSLASHARASVLDALCSEHRRARTPIVLFGFSLAYFIAARIGIATSLPPEGIVILWPPNAVILIALLSVDRAKWPLFFAVTVLTEIAADVPDYPLWAAAGYGVVNFSEAAFAAALLSRIKTFHLPIAGVRSFLFFLVAGPLVASAVAAFAGAAIYEIGSPEIDYLQYWRVFWFGDAVGLMVVGTTLLALRWPPAWIYRSTTAGVIGEAVLVSVTLLLAASWAFFGYSELPAVYLLFPCLLWSALRFGVHGAAASLLITVALAIYSAKAEVGPFAGMSTIDAVIFLQGLIGVASLSTFMLAFSVEDMWRRTFELREEALQHAETRDRLREANEQLGSYNRELDEKVKERTAELERALVYNRFLLGELHHRVKNNLQIVSSLITMQAKNSTDAALRVKLQGQIAAVAKTYDVLHRLEAAEVVDLCELVPELCRGIESAMADGCQILVETSGNCVVPSEDAVGLSIALNELITNAAKHAASGIPEVFVRCAREGNQVILEVTDNGGGFASDFDPRNAGGFGLRMAYLMIERANGSLAFRSSDRGSTAYICIASAGETPPDNVVCGE